MTPEKDLLYELYVLGQLEEPERGEIEEALRRNDPAAQARLRKALETNAILGTLPSPVEPSKALRRRILAMNSSRRLTSRGPGINSISSPAHSAPGSRTAK